MPLARVDHGFNGKCHARFQYHSSALAPIVEYLWLFVEYSSDAMAAVFAYYRIVVFLRMSLDDGTDIAQGGSGFYNIDGPVQALLGYFD